jgi:hypothetical protein
VNDKQIAYRSKIRIERLKGPLRLAWLPAEEQPVLFGTHGAIAEHYGMDPKKLAEPHATTIDYVIAATGS